MARALVHASLPGAHLQALYTAAVPDLQDGKVAMFSGRLANVLLAPSKKLMTLIAILDAPSPWRYRKLVWYYQ